MSGAGASRRACTHLSGFQGALNLGCWMCVCSRIASTASSPSRVRILCTAPGRGRPRQRRWRHDQREAGRGAGCNASEQALRALGGRCKEAAQPSAHDRVPSCNWCLHQPGPHLQDVVVVRLQIGKARATGEGRHAALRGGRRYRAGFQRTMLLGPTVQHAAHPHQHGAHVTPRPRSNASRLSMAAGTRCCTPLEHSLRIPLSGNPLPRPRNRARTSSMNASSATNTSAPHTAIATKVLRHPRLCARPPPSSGPTIGPITARGWIGGNEGSRGTELKRHRRIRPSLLAVAALSIHGPPAAADDTSARIAWHIAPAPAAQVLSKPAAHASGS